MEEGVFFAGCTGMRGTGMRGAGMRGTGMRGADVRSADVRRAGMRSTGPGLRFYIHFTETIPYHDFSGCKSYVYSKR
ncbi:hypothetical protein ADH76_20235 [Enterocloster clostridioformis]|nr:hypothetical protein A4V08_18640 [Lachnoclostridium sp. YL32]OXE66303.1 hypothetical protein ADH76_20235 [Enterocloster clostridioformis]